MSFKDERRRRYAAKRQRQEDIQSSSSSSAEGLLAVDRHVARGIPSSITEAAAAAFPLAIQKIQLEDVRHIHQRMLLPQSTPLTPTDRLLLPYMDLRGCNTNDKKRKIPAKRSDGSDCNESGESSYLFIAEGTETVRVLLQRYQQTRTSSYTSFQSSSLQQDVSLPPPPPPTPPFMIQSILIKPQLLFAEPVLLWTDIEASLRIELEGVAALSGGATTTTHPNTASSPPPFVVFVASEETQCAMAGFATSRGCLACGIVPAHLCDGNDNDEAWLDAYLSNSRRVGAKHCSSNTGSNGIRILALDGITDTANMGSMIRTATALGMHAVVLSANCCDPWDRRAVRVSMGHVVSIPIVRVHNLAQWLAKMQQQPQPDDVKAIAPIAAYAAVVDSNADLVLCQMKRGMFITFMYEGFRSFVTDSLLVLFSTGNVTDRWCCVFGNEANGISDAVIQACHATIRIDMANGVDSLSVQIAAGILLNGLREREGNTEERASSNKRIKTIFKQD